MNTIIQRLQAIQQHIALTAKQYQRAVDDITLLAVSKQQPLARIQTAYDAGLRQFGENYVQEALTKMPALPNDIQWHFIGALQSNKARLVAEHFTWLHTVTSGKIAAKLNQYRPAQLPRLNVCIEVNIDGEDSKAGVTAAMVPVLAQTIIQCPRLCLRGLMAIPRPHAQFEQQRVAFERLAKLQQSLIQQGFKLDTLSMGMSQDYPAAIAAGATMIRLGTALLGERNN